ncbi:MAG: hypothetical protein JW938_07945 [Candidatus Omnitrophica bacterium]|nr:hypothetical protein [Candidatus Omnitrophota bacterium]
MDQLKMVCAIIVLGIAAIQPCWGIIADEGSETPALVVSVYNKNGLQPLKDVRISVEGEDPDTHFGREEVTNEEGVARFYKQDFKNFVIHKDLEENVTGVERYDGESTLTEGHVKVKLIVTNEWNVTEEHELQVRLNEEVSYRVNMSGVE